MTNPDLWAEEFRRHSYALVVDELHHAKVKRDGQLEPLARAISQLKYAFRLDMTGVLETADNKYIHDLDYQFDSDLGGEKVVAASNRYRTLQYARADALAENALVPIEFHHNDGPVSFVNKNGRRDMDLSQAEEEDESAAIFTALNTEYATQLFAAGVEHWQRYGRPFGGKLLVVTARQRQAELYAQRLRDIGVPTALAITDNDEAGEEIDAFRDEAATIALVTCGMCYEGLDSPPLTHGIALTHIRSKPWIEQMFGRIWRAAPGKERCWFFVPDDPRMNRVIEKIRRETPGIVVEPRGEGGAGGGLMPIIPISANVERLRKTMLDAGMLDDLPAALMALGLKFGLEPKSGEALATIIEQWRPIKERENRPRYQTEKEQETTVRNQIANRCRALDYEQKVDLGTHQRRLYKITGKIMDEMTLQELIKAAEHVARFDA